METEKRIWHGLAWQSEERFDLSETDDGYVAAGDIAGETEAGQLFVINYTVTLSPDWDIENVVVQDARAGRSLELVHKLGRWYDGRGILLPEFDGIEYVDISLTPFTNSLPIKTLELASPEPEEIEVIYIDAAMLAMSRATQFYAKTGDNSYLFETRDDAPFTAKIDVDESGLVTQYHGLFEVDA